MKTIKYKKNSKEIRRIIARGALDSTVSRPVSKILAIVRSQRDKALFSYTRKFDKVCLTSRNVRVSKREIKAASARLNPQIAKSLKLAAKNIGSYHKKQLAQAKSSFKTGTLPGVTVGEKTTPLASVGCYVPGGRAAYPSTVLMTALVAKVAGVRRVVVVSPPEIPDAVLAACQISGVDEVYRVGGAQAVSALAYGTESIKPVDKIVGPGNNYVTEAKRQVYGTVDIDMPAGPSEVLILADDSANPAFIAADILAQAEHDPDAQCILVTPSSGLSVKVKRQVSNQLKKLPRKRVINSSLKNAAVVLTKNNAESVTFANDYAPEHLQVMAKNPGKIAGKITNAGAVFIGAYSPVAAGDYASGGNHVLPTGGAAKFSSPLTVRDFLKTVCVQEITEKGLRKLAETITALAESEGLKAHAESVRKRLD